MEILTAGFTKWSARAFFDVLRAERVEQLIDVRLVNRSQLAGFAKRDDLEYFLEALVGASYQHEPTLAPTPELLDDYRARRISWGEYETRFRELMVARAIEEVLAPDRFATRTVLLCSEHEPERCHRRLVVEHLADHWPAIQAVHLPR